MKKIMAVLMGSIFLTACLDESTTEQDLLNNDDTSAEGDPRTETHSICKFVDNNEGDDILAANEAIDEAENWLLIESMLEAASATLAEIDSLPEADRAAGVFASTAFLAPSFADMFTPFYIIYSCTETTYSLNQCNWDNGFQGDASLKIETVVGSSQNYTSTVSTKVDTSAGLQQAIVLQGTIGDLGNLTLDLYEDGVNVGSRQATRTNNGTETVRWTSSNTNWVATETSGCSGSLEYEDVRENDTITVNAQWNFSGSTTSGSLDYQRVGDTSSSFSIDW